MERIRSFVVVAKHLNYEKASEKMFLSTSTLHRRIRRLEDELEDELFLKSKKGIQLTKKGEHFLPIAQEIIKNFEKGKRSLKNNTLTIGVSPYVANYVISDFLPFEELPYFDKYPIFCDVREGYWTKLRESILTVVPDARFRVIENLQTVINLIAENRGISYLPAHVLRTTSDKRIKAIVADKITTTQSTIYFSTIEESQETEQFKKLLSRFLNVDKKALVNKNTL